MYTTSTNTTGDAATNEIVIRSDCICSGHSLQITCSVMGIGSTVWEGNLFDCPSSNNEILLLHNDFKTSLPQGTCNNNNIIARGLSFSEQNCFLSQLTLTPSTATNGQSVTCIHDNGPNSMDVGTVIVNITTGKILKK